MIFIYAHDLKFDLKETFDSSKKNLDEVFNNSKSNKEKNNEDLNKAFEKKPFDFYDELLEVKDDFTKFTEEVSNIFNSKGTMPTVEDLVVGYASLPDIQSSDLAYLAQTGNAAGHFTVLFNSKDKNFENKFQDASIKDLALTLGSFVTFSLESKSIPTWTKFKDLKKIAFYTSVSNILFDKISAAVEAQAENVVVKRRPIPGVIRLNAVGETLSISLGFDGKNFGIILSGVYSSDKYLCFFDIRQQEFQLLFVYNKVIKVRISHEGVSIVVSFPSEILGISSSYVANKTNHFSIFFFVNIPVAEGLFLNLAFDIITKTPKLSFLFFAENIVKENVKEGLIKAYDEIAQMWEDQKSKKEQSEESEPFFNAVETDPDFVLNV